MSAQPIPTIHLALSITPSTHSFASDSLPPTLTVTATSQATQPITLFTWNSALDPHSGLTSAAFVITDITTGSVVETSRIRVQRLPFKRVRGCADERYLLTLPPSAPVSQTTPFGRGGAKPQPKAIAERGWELDDHGREMRIRRSVRPTGVDGLEPGHEYRIDFHGEALRALRWSLGGKEDVLVERDGEDAGMLDFHWEERPLEFLADGCTLNVVA